MRAWFYLDFFSLLDPDKLLILHVLRSWELVAFFFSVRNSFPDHLFNLFDFNKLGFLRASKLV
jgi:hypothetical protein